LMNISRVHETISIHTKGNKKINKVKIPYMEMKHYNIDSIIGDVKRLKSCLTNKANLDLILEFLENNKIEPLKPTVKHKIIGGHFNTEDRNITVLKQIKHGLKEKSIIRTDRKDCKTFTKHGITPKKQSGDRPVNVMQSINYGLNEKSIISQTRDHYTAIHPTQKPIRLLERLLLLTSQDSDIVFDPFIGSGSTAIAAFRLNRKYIGCEIDKEYYEDCINRIDEETSQLIINF